MKRKKILYECLENGLSFKISQGNVLTLAPPLIITEEELDHAMDIVEKRDQKILQLKYHVVLLIK